MNHLAHLFLAGDDAPSLIGNLAGDFVKGPLHDRFPAAIADGIRNHRAVDAFTDAHPDAAAFRRVLTPEHGHYARIIADVFFDHFLASDWARYTAEPLPAFLERVFTVIDPHAAELPGRLRSVYPHMRSGEWFASYREIDGIERVLRQMSTRLSRPHRLDAATRHLTDSRAELQRHFDVFFPQLVERFKS